MLESVPPQNSKHYQAPFGNDDNFVNHPGVADIYIQSKSPKNPSRHAVFLQLLACLARQPSAFTLMCGTDTAERGAVEPPTEGGARPKLCPTDNSSSANRILRPRQKRNSWPNPWHRRRILYRFVWVNVTRGSHLRRRHTKIRRWGAHGNWHYYNIICNL